MIPLPGTAVRFSATLFLSAFLLFLIQPMIGKMVLPLLGGSPMVWNTCMVFFQVTLLAGYLYAHLLSRMLDVRRAICVHVLLMLPVIGTLIFVTLPYSLAHGPAAGSGRLLPDIPSGVFTELRDRLHLDTAQDRPIVFLLATLALSVGAPLFLLSASAPLCQRWFAHTAHSASRDPYFLYAASNAGSLLALLAYPILVEPNLGLLDQASAWAVGYVVVVVLLGACGVSVLISLARPRPQLFEPAAVPRLTDQPLTFGRRFRWLFLAAVPSSLLLGVTTHLTTDVAALPLFWVVPLALYLLTFILAFRRSSVSNSRVRVGFMATLVILQTQALAHGLTNPPWLLFPLHLIAFFAIALVCHGELAASRPSSEHLTEFYLWLSLGGVLGGMFNTLVAPWLFDLTFELPLAIVLACLLMPRLTESSDKRFVNWLDLWLPVLLGLLVATAALTIGTSFWPHVVLVGVLPSLICLGFVRRPVRFALGVGALMLAGSLGSTSVSERHLVYIERNFFGTIRVVDGMTDERTPRRYREFIHGTTTHGRQILSDDRVERNEPLAYFGRSGPVGDIFASLPPKQRFSRSFGILGLGIGTLASYFDVVEEPAQTWFFYEIDPAVIEVAKGRFNYLSDVPIAKKGQKYVFPLKEKLAFLLDIYPGDARLGLERSVMNRLDILFADAFSSDAVPVHLLTREALGLYMRSIQPAGFIVFNVTNRYLDLEPVLGDLAADAGLVCIARRQGAEELSAEDFGKGIRPSHWVVMARKEEDLGNLAKNPRWHKVEGRPGVRVWSDDYSNLLGAFRWR
jgi:hypothetical protein